MVSVTEPKGANTPDEIATFIEELDNEIKNTAHLQQGGSIPGNLTKCAKVNRNLLENKVGGEENEEDKLKPSLKLKFFSCEYCNNCFAKKEFWLRHRKSSELLFLNTNFALKNDKVLFQCNLFWESIQNLNKGKGGEVLKLKPVRKCKNKPNKKNCIEPCLAPFNFIGGF